MILVVNAGSSNVKFAIFTADTLLEKHRTQVDSIQQVFTWLAENPQFKITAAGHRIVHGGNKYTKPMIISESVITELKKLIPLAPLHQPYNILAIEKLAAEYPSIPQVVCFDTAFHATQEPIAKIFAIPKELTTEGIIRYGFHGLSYEYIASILTKKIGPIAQQKVIVAHLGNGASMCAMLNLRSVATSMSFSALDGLMMGSRCGSIDPGVLLYLLQEKKYTTEQLVDLLYKKSGLLGVSNISNDVRILLASQENSAQEAIELFCYKAAQEFAKLTVSSGGCDALVFTGGIGENAAPIRGKICSNLVYWGIKIEQDANIANATLISSNDSKIKVAVVPTYEEYMIAQHVKNFLTHMH